MASSPGPHISHLVLGGAKGAMQQSRALPRTWTGTPTMQPNSPATTIVNGLDCNACRRVLRANIWPRRTKYRTLKNVTHSRPHAARADRRFCDCCAPSSCTRREVVRVGFVASSCVPPSSSPSSPLPFPRSQYQFPARHPPSPCRCVPGRLLPSPGHRRGLLGSAGDKPSLKHQPSSSTVTRRPSSPIPFRRAAIPQRRDTARR